jgi:2,3-bisphosphoglycerate-dependent phosphoglycerate mutase
VTEILLARHGETDWNRESRFQGHADPPLNDLGRQQAVELAAALSDQEFVAVYSSPLRRALETAQTVAESHGLTAVPVEGLREVDVGSWQALTRDEVEQRFPQQFRRWLDYGRGWDDGETYEEMGDRVLATLEQLAARHEGEQIVAVTHGGPIRAALARAQGISHSEARRRGPALGNCFVVRFTVKDGRFERVG